MSDRVDVLCPFCSTQLTIDKETGEILAEVRPKVDHQKTFESAMNEVQSGAERRQDAFD